MGWVNLQLAARPLLGLALLGSAPAAGQEGPPRDAEVLLAPGASEAWAGVPASEDLRGWEPRLVASPVDSETGELSGAAGLITRDAHPRFHLGLELWSPGGGGGGGDSAAVLEVERGPRVPLGPLAQGWHRVDLAWDHSAGEQAHLRVWTDGILEQDARVEVEGVALAAGSARGLRAATAPGEASEALDWGGSFTVFARFRTEAGGTLLSKCPPRGDWVPDAKALFLRDGRLVYDIGWVGALQSRRSFHDGEEHRVALVVEGDFVRMFVDGQLEAERDGFRADDRAGFVLKVGAANEDFGGDLVGAVGEAAFLARALSEDEALELSAGERRLTGSAWSWTPAPEDGRPRFAAGEAVPARVALREAAGLRLGSAWMVALDEVDHAQLVGSWDDDAFDRGEEIYGGLCIACHGADGRRTPNPQARPFATAPLQNGADPYSLFLTVTHGYRDMPGNDWLTPRQRYDVIHYLREQFWREGNASQFVPVSEEYLTGLPKGRVASDLDAAAEVEERDFGPALASELGAQVGAALTVRLDEGTSIAYDLHTLRSPAAWVGGFLDLSETQHFRQRGEGLPQIEGDPLPGLAGYGWRYGGVLEERPSIKPARGPLPADLLDYRGHHLHGRSAILEARVQGRRVLERPGVDHSSGLPAITHRLHIAPGPEPLELDLARLDLAPRRARTAVTLHAELAEVAGQPVRSAVIGPEGGVFVGVALVSDARLGLRASEAEGVHRAWLEIPPSDEPIELELLRFAGSKDSERAAFQTLLTSLPERGLSVSPRAQLGGGPRLWDAELVTQGTLGEVSGGYALDTLTLPEENPWNAWLRTSALDFFDDGRAAVCTYGGDVWLVDGVDAGLERLVWTRFVAGLYEPMGLKVVDGKVLVTCRDGIVRLHDHNGDGQADQVERLFADPDVSATFHAFNFDLQVDPEGWLLYAKSGQYTDYDQGGAILRVAPDGSRYEVWATGLRTPNGMGIASDGTPLVSDNQGNWIPASKITRAERGAFMGVFPAIDTNRPGMRTRTDFQPPVLWMPQGFDSSSGGQLFVEDARFGPLAGLHLHTSFGKGWMYPLDLDTSGPVAQGAAWRLPFQFAAGIQRLRTNPADGQVYAVGLSGWQGPAGGQDGCLQRVRWTGRGGPMLTGARLVEGGLRLAFSAALPEGAELEAGARTWNYRWTQNYGSAHRSVAEPGREGEDRLEVGEARWSADRRSALLPLPDLAPADQVVVEFAVRGGAEELVAEEVFLTANWVPGDPVRLREREECQEEVPAPWIELEGGEGPGKGRRIVLISGDEEYRSEECLPALAAILAEHHGFDCTVLFSVDPGSGRVDPNNQVFTPGLERIEGADLVVLFTRFREWPDSAMRHFAAHVEAGKPLLGLRTSTHAFQYDRDPGSPYARYSTRGGGVWDGGFGREVLGETWIAHHGAHGSEATRGVVAPGAGAHPILRGVEGVFGPTDVYRARALPEDAVVLLEGEVVAGMDPSDPPVEGKKNAPRMPILWTRERAAGEGIQRVVTSTIGSAQDFESEGLRRAWVNSCYWLLGLEEQIPPASKVDLVGAFEPVPFGFGRFRKDRRPADWAPRSR